MADEKKGDKKDEPRSSFVPLLFEIEIGNDKNRAVLFQPTQERLRGAWKRSNLNSDELTEVTQRLPDIPGLRIMLDAKSGRAVIYDPLGMPENEAVLQQAAALAKEVFGTNCGPVKERQYTEMKPDDIKTWAHWMRRLIQGSNARLTKGVAPSENEVKSMEGKAGAGRFDSSSRAFKFTEDAEDYFNRILNSAR
jgi:hypothetical protein